MATLAARSSRSIGRLARLLVRAVAPLVPASARPSWTQQWLADLHYQRDWLLTSRASRAAMERDLVRRATGACRHAAWLRWRHWRTHMLLQDIKYACRGLARRPGFSAVIVLTLTIGIGANATIFSWLDALVFNPLPGVTDVSALVVLHGTTPTRHDLSFSYPNYRDLRDLHPKGFSGFAASRNLALGMRVGAGEPERTWAEIVSGNYFDVLGVSPSLGRLITQADDGAELAGGVAVLSDRLWRARFGARTDVVGTAVTINARPFVVIGVAAPGFKGATNGLAADLWLPMSMQRVVMTGSRLEQRGNGWLSVVARLAPGTNRAAAIASAVTAAQALEAIDPVVNKGRGMSVASLSEDGAGLVLVPVMTVVMAVVVVVLIIACANIAGLMLARGMSRSREVAIRLAVGASRGQIVRQLLIESLVLALAGGAAGIGVAALSGGLLASLLPPLPYAVLIPSGINARVLLVALAAVGVATVVFGLVPALQSSRPNMVPSLRDGAGATGGLRRARLRRILVAGQVALALVLLVSAGLFARTLVNAQRVNPGFDERRAVLASIDLTAAGYDTTTGTLFYRDLVSRIEALPGIRRAAVTTQMPLSLSGSSDTSPKIEGYVPVAHEDITIYYTMVSAHYFDALRLPIRAGRAIDDRDTAAAPLTVVINETMAKRYWKGRDPVGGRLDYGGGWATVTGVAADGKYGTIAEAPRSVMYVPIDQAYRPTPTLIVATTGDPAVLLPDIRREVTALNPNLPLFEVRTLDEHLTASVFLPRLASMLLGSFGGLALLLAVIGLYGVVAYGVTMRTREIGLRMALGAGRASIRREVLGQGVRLALIGLVAGLALAAAVTPLLASQLVGGQSMDATVFASTSLVLLFVSAIATGVPAWRASRIDPMEALRQE